LHSIKKILSNELNKRQIELLEILNKCLPKDEFVSYGKIIDVVIKHAPNLYNDFGEGPLRFTSLTLLEDLRKLWYYGYLKWSEITHPEFGVKVPAYKIGMKLIIEEEVLR